MRFSSVKDGTSCVEDVGTFVLNVKNLKSYTEVKNLSTQKRPRKTLSSVVTCPRWKTLNWGKIEEIIEEGLELTKIVEYQYKSLDVYYT